MAFARVASSFWAAGTLLALVLGPPAALAAEPAEAPAASAPRLRRPPLTLQ
jgi:hypothetical protein